MKSFKCEVFYDLMEFTFHFAGCERGQPDSLSTSSPETTMR